MSGLKLTEIEVKPGDSIMERLDKKGMLQFDKKKKGLIINCDNSELNEVVEDFITEYNVGDIESEGETK